MSRSLFERKNAVNTEIFCCIKYNRWNAGDRIKEVISCTMLHQKMQISPANSEGKFFLKKFCRRGINAEFKGNSVGKFSDVFQTVERIFRHFSDNLQEYSTVVNRTANIVNYLFSGRKRQKNGSPGGDRTHDQLLRRQ